MHSPWIASSPYISYLPALGLLLAVLCGLLGGILWIYFRDIAGHGMQPARRWDDLTPSHSQNTQVSHHSSGGCVGLVLCCILGGAACLLLGNRTEFVREITEVYFPDSNSQNKKIHSGPVQMYFSSPRPSNADWTDNHWTADDAPFLKIRHEVDAGISSGKIKRYDAPDGNLSRRVYWL
jgi:hypothetical protein